MAEKKIPVPREIPSLVIPLSSETLLFPNVSVAEIALHIEIETTVDCPNWFLGYIQWRGLHVPVVSFAALNGGEPEVVGRDSRVAVVNGIQGDMKLPFYSVVVEGLPRLVRVLPNTLQKEQHNDLAIGQLCKANIAGQEVTIPNLERIENMLLIYLNEISS